MGKPKHQNRFQNGKSFLCSTISGRFAMSDISILFPARTTRGSLQLCLTNILTKMALTHFFTYNQPMCANNMPRRALCGSALVSEYRWCTLWSLTQWKTVPWFAIEANIMTKNRYGKATILWLFLNRNAANSYLLRSFCATRVGDFRR